MNSNRRYFVGFNPKNCVELVVDRKSETDIYIDITVPKSTKKTAIGVTTFGSFFIAAAITSITLGTSIYCYDEINNISHHDNRKGIFALIVFAGLPCAITGSAITGGGGYLLQNSDFIIEVKYDNESYS